MGVGSNVDHTFLVSYLKEFSIHSTLFCQYNQNIFLRLLISDYIFSQNLLLILEGNFNMIVGHVQGACMLIIRRFL